MAKENRCIVPGCNNRAHAKGYCRKHYGQIWRKGKIYSIEEEEKRGADKLVQRDRDGDDRRVCLECVYLRHGGRCGNWRAAGVASNAMDARFPGDFTTMLQRCDGYQLAINSSIQSNS